jgi:DNA-binding NarL/FixJ family response regulator
MLSATRGAGTVTVRGERDVIRILFVEDHTALREGTRALLATTRDLVVISEASTAQDAVFLAEQLRPDVVLLDLRLAEESSGFDAARHILHAVPGTAILVLTGVEDPEYARAALKLGIRGYLLKTASMAEIAAAIRQVHAGQPVLDPTIAAALAAPRERDRRVGGLTERERRILRLLAQGHSNQQIAETLVLSVRTVEWQVARLPKKLGLPSRAALIAYAVREATATEAALPPDPRIHTSSAGERGSSGSYGRCKS